MNNILMSMILPVVIVIAMIFFEIQINLIMGRDAFDIKSYNAVPLVFITFFGLASKMLTDQKYEYYYWLVSSIFAFSIASYYVLKKFYKT
jgi:hypothetical protein